MNLINAIAMVTVLQFLFIATLVGQAHGKSGVQAPAVTGNEHLERAYVSDPKRRGLGFLLSIGPVFVLAFAGLVGAFMFRVGMR